MNQDDHDDFRKELLGLGKAQEVCFGLGACDGGTVLESTGRTDGFVVLCRTYRWCKRRKYRKSWPKEVMLWLERWTA